MTDHTTAADLDAQAINAGADAIRAAVVKNLPHLVPALFGSDYTTWAEVAIRAAETVHKASRTSREAATVTSPDRTAVRNQIAHQLHSVDCGCNTYQPDPADNADQYRRQADAVEATLTAVGLLLPAGATITEQWSVRKSSVADGEGYGLPSNSRAAAEYDRDRWLGLNRNYPATGVLVRREVRRWTDGSVFAGPWTPVEETP